MALFPPEHTTIDKAHGRLELRHVWTSTELNDYLCFPYVSQVFCIQRNSTVLVSGKQHSEIVCGVTSVTTICDNPFFELYKTYIHFDIQSIANLLKFVRARGRLDPFILYLGNFRHIEETILTQTSQEGSHIMDIRTIKLVFFSPTETTARIVNGIAQGIGPAISRRIDLTPPGAKRHEVEQMPDELTIIGTPVHAGRVPTEAVRRLQLIKGKNTPAVVVVVYGNREYEDALLELRDIVAELGFRPIAGGAFIGEHSYSSETTPIAPGRPDGKDMEKAKRFGESIHEKISSFHTLDDMPVLQVPGNYPYIEWDQPPKMAPVTVESLCTLCAKCAAACPTAAITVEESVLTSKEACIRCSACIKRCPSGARKWESARIDQIRKWLNENCRQRKEPQIYL